MISPRRQPLSGDDHVSRLERHENVPHSLGSVDPQRDIDTMEGEFLINDLIAVEGKLERLGEELRRNSRDKAVVNREIALFTRDADVLEQALMIFENDWEFSDPLEKEGFTE